MELRQVPPFQNPRFPANRWTNPDSKSPPPGMMIRMQLPSLRRTWSIPQFIWSESSYLLPGRIEGKLPTEEKCICQKLDGSPGTAVKIELKGSFLFSWGELGRLIDQLMYWLIHWVIDWFTDSFIELDWFGFTWDREAENSLFFSGSVEG